MRLDRFAQTLTARKITYVRDAAIHFAIIIGLVIAALGVLFFGYIFLCFTIIFLIAAFAGGSMWALMWAALGVALLHIGAAVAAVFIAKNRFSQPVFETTMQEFRKDQEWLNSKTARQL
jgi:uncharacterized membrane protein YqjE